jgi:secretory lipase
MHRGKPRLDERPVEGDEAMQSRGVRRFIAASVAILACLEIAGASGASGIAPPSSDSFYRYNGRTPLAHIPAGTPLRERSVTLGIDTTQTPLPAEQILYRTTDATGKAVASVTTVLLPLTGTVAPRVVAYLSFYDALASKCDPSYTLRGGDPGAANKNLTDVEQVLVHTLHAQGYIVTVPDFEDETLDYVAGTESGMSTLDGIKATLKILKLGSSTPVGLVGYSGGSIAADWASELQPRYAPHVNLIGTAMGGIPVNLAHNLRYIDGSPSWSDVIPAAFTGISRSFHLDLTPYLSAWGRKVVATESNQCIGEMQGEFPNLTIKRLMKPQYADVTHVAVFRRILDKLTMGTAPGHPAEPMLMVWGNSDGTGDGVMVAADEAKLAAEYCKQGVPILAEEFKGLDHIDAAVTFFAQAFPWLASRFVGLPAPSNCA